LGHLEGIGAIGHRVVQGGRSFTRPVIVDNDVRKAIEELVPLAPLHNPAALAGIDASTRVFPDMPQVAAFDTAFHATMPDAAAVYPVPWEWTQRGLRRLGFHGLSVQYSTRRVTELVGHQPDRMVVCHLGAGCSITAVAGGRSVDTTMGLTPLEGLMMAVRSGSIDPGLMLYLLREQQVDLDEMEKSLNGRSGLLGVSGVSSDLRAVISAADSGNTRAQLALNMFVHSVVIAVGRMIGVLGGLDCLVFTGGIGENSALIRSRVCQQFGFVGVYLEDAVNASAEGDTDLSRSQAAVKTLVIAAREDLAILSEMKRLLPAVLN
jgi:acetate kinase